MNDEFQYKIDLARIYSVDEFQDVLREALPLPEYYGGTLDALYDVFTDQGRKWSIYFTGCAEAEAILGKYMRNFKKMCERATKEAPDMIIVFED
ncbi:MAG: barstar family protein [Lachnospiraceae bacterium]|jgi:RNAse (barnase) inhibitor barstar|nr:barstar family protein [Lachnospiraceae bacterium]